MTASISRSRTPASRDVSHLGMIRHCIEEAADIVGWSESEAARLRPVNRPGFAGGVVV
jgi:hypothetical protein